MAFIQLDFLSKCLNMHTAVNIALPMPKDTHAPMEDIPCIYLLHDAGEDMTSWQRNVPVERYENAFGAAVIMPDGALSFYEDMVHGGMYKRYIAEELPFLLRSYFPLSAKRERNFIAGCGMGGRGAVKIALENPDNYGAAGMFCASHAEEKARNEAMESALFRAYGRDAGVCRRLIEAKAAEVARTGPDTGIFHFTAGEAEAGVTRSMFESAGGHIQYRFEAFSGRDDWAVREKMLVRFMEEIRMPAPEEEMK